MRGFAMALFLGAAIPLPISKSGFGAGEIVTSSSWSPQVLEHRATDVIATPFNSWSVKSIAKRVATSVLPRSPFSCCHKAAGYPNRITGVVPTYGPIVDNGGDKNTTPPIQARNASFWGRADVDDTPADTEQVPTTTLETPSIQARNASFWGRANVDETPRDAEKGTIIARDTATIQARNASFWGRANVDQTPRDAEKGTITTRDTATIQARNGSFWGRDTATIQARNASFWGRANVDEAPRDAKKNTITTRDTATIQARNGSFWGRDYMDDTRAAAGKRNAVTSDTPAIRERNPQAPTFWGPSHVDDTPADAEDSAGSLDDGDAIVGNAQKSA